MFGKLQTAHSPQPHSLYLFHKMFNYDWYLLVLFVWRTILPMLAEMEPLVLAAGSMGLAMAALFLDHSEVANEQLVFSFLPYFLAGFHFKRMDGYLYQWRQMRWPFWIAMIWGVVLVSSIFYLPVPFQNQTARAFICLYGGWPRDVGFWSLDNPGMTCEAIQNRSMVLPRITACRAPEMVAQILGLHVMSAISLPLFLAMVPERPIPLVTQAGENSLYMYILHWYVAYPFATLTSDLDPNIRTALAIFVSLAVWAFLAPGRINKLFRFIVEPPVDFLMKTEEA